MIKSSNIPQIFKPQFPVLVESSSMLSTGRIFKTIPPNAEPQFRKPSSGDLSFIAFGPIYVWKSVGLER